MCTLNRAPLYYFSQAYNDLMLSFLEISTKIKKTILVEISNAGTLDQTLFLRRNDSLPTIDLLLNISHRNNPTKKVIDVI